MHQTSNNLKIMVNGRRRENGRMVMMTITNSAKENISADLKSQRKKVMLINNDV